MDGIRREECRVRSVISGTLKQVSTWVKALSLNSRVGLTGPLFTRCLT